MLGDLNIENLDETFLKYSAMMYMKDSGKSDGCYLNLLYASSS